MDDRAQWAGLDQDRRTPLARTWCVRPPSTHLQICYKSHTYFHMPVSKQYA